MKIEFIGTPAGEELAFVNACKRIYRWGAADISAKVFMHPRNANGWLEWLIVIAGEHDSRCPLGQVMVYAHALRARGHEVDVHLYAGGHHALQVEEKIAHARSTIDFFRRRLAG